MGLRQQIEHRNHSTLSEYYSCTNVAMYQFDKNDISYRHLKISSIHDEINTFANKYVNRLKFHTDAVAKRLPDNSQNIRRLECLKPYDLI